MKTLIRTAVVAVMLILSGCASTTPFAGAERGRCYTVDEFEKAVIQEKVLFLENELKNLRAPNPTDPDEVKLWPFMMREFPTLRESRIMKEKALPGDQVCEFHHRLFGKVYDGPEEAGRRGYALIRGDRIVYFIMVDPLFDVHY